MQNKTPITQRTLRAAHSDGKLRDSIADLIADAVLSLVSDGIQNFSLNQQADVVVQLVKQHRIASRKFLAHQHGAP